MQQETGSKRCRTVRKRQRGSHPDIKFEQPHGGEDQDPGAIRTILSLPTKKDKLSAELGAAAVITSEEERVKTTVRPS